MQQKQEAEFQAIGPLISAIHWAREVFRTNPAIWLGPGQGTDIFGQFRKHVERTRSIVQPQTLEILRVQDDTVQNTHSFLARRKVESEQNFILLKGTSNLCWSRFSACKEMCHLLTDTEARHMCENIVGQLKSASQRPSACQQLGSKNLSSEHFCYFFALELCMPWSVRLENGNTECAGATSSEIAAFYKTPEAIIEQALTSGYFLESKQLNSALDDFGPALTL